MAGRFDSNGIVRYVLPAPLGMFVPGGRVRACSEEEGLCADAAYATLLVELHGATRESESRSALPQQCSPGYLGDSESVEHQLLPFRDGIMVARKLR